MIATTKNSKNSSENIVTAIGLGAIFLCALIWGVTKYRLVQGADENLQVLLQQEIAQEAFSGISSVTPKVFSEVDCAGSDKPGISCKAVGSELVIIEFKTISPMPKFRIHAVKNIVDQEIQMEIRNVSGLPNYQERDAIEKIVEAFRNPNI